MTPTGDKARGSQEAFVEVTQESDGWHWMLWSGNGRQMARSAVGYPDKKHCVQAIQAVPDVFAKAKVIVMASGDQVV
jgi:uncharacterized protein YegP (UPF0339 family)